MNAITRPFVLSAIRESLPHEHQQDRRAVLKALVEGCRRAFPEDNVPTRISFLVEEMMRCDDEFQEIAARVPGFAAMVAGAAQMAVLDSQKVKRPT